MADSFWLEDPAEPLPRPAWRGRADVIVIGGGVTGCSCALALAEAGVRVRLHEAREIASGASGRNGGFALRGAAMPYDIARERLGAEAATGLWRLTEHYLDRLESLAGDAFRRVGSLRLAADEAERRSLLAERKALHEDGFDAAWVDELDPPLDGRYHGALLHPTDGSIHPARWVRRLAQRAARAGADLREHSRVERLEDHDADHVVLATDGYGQGFVPALDAAVKPTRGQVVVTEPLGRMLYGRPTTPASTTTTGSRPPIGASSSAGGGTPRPTSSSPTRSGRRRRSSESSRRSPPTSSESVRGSPTAGPACGARPPICSLSSVLFRVGPASGSPSATRAMGTSSASPRASWSRERCWATPRPGCGCSTRRACSR